MNNMRALLIGGAAADRARLAAQLAPGAIVMCFAEDRAIGDAMKQSVTSATSGAQVRVMLGDPWLLISKVAGPFDLIVVPRDAPRATAEVRARLRTLLRENGELDG